MDVQADLPLSVNIIGLSGLFVLFFIDVAMCDSVHGVETIRQYLESFLK